MSGEVKGYRKVLPLAGHRCLGAHPCVEVRCECGWVSCPHSGEDARAEAYSEWRGHLVSHGAEREPIQTWLDRSEKERAKLYAKIKKNAEPSDV